LFDPYVYPGFPEPTVEIGQIWDTSSSLFSNFMDKPGTLDEDDNDKWDNEDEEEEDDYDDWEDEDDEELWEADA
jgi:hypothetical protein